MSEQPNDPTTDPTTEPIVEPDEPDEPDTYEPMPTDAPGDEDDGDDWKEV